MLYTGIAYLVMSHFSNHMCKYVLYHSSLHIGGQCYLSQKLM